MSLPFYIHAMGWALPGNVFDDEFLHREVGLEKGPDWNRSRLGIHKRRSVLSRDYVRDTKNADPSKAVAHARALGETPVSLAVRAAQQALETARVSPAQIGLVVANGDTPFDFLPTLANSVARILGVGDGPHVDLNSACSSFARHMKFVADLAEEARPEFILTIQSSAYTTRTDYSPKSIDGYIWGDGAAAQVCSKHPAGLRVEPMVFGTSPKDADTIVVDSCGHFRQDGAAVREFSIRKTVEMFEAVAGAKGLYAEDVYTVSHQANAVMQDSILGHLRLPPARHLRNVAEQGNIAAAGAPSVLAQNWNRFRKGDQIVYAVLGAGLAWGGGYMEKV